MPEASHKPSTDAAAALGQRLRGPLMVLAIIAVATALKWTMSVSMPLFFALFLAALLGPIQAWLERYMPAGVALLCTLLLLCGFFAGIVGLLMLAADSVAERLPFYADRMDTLRSSVQSTADGWGFQISEKDLAWTNLIQRMGDGAPGIMRAMAVRAGFIVLVLGFLILAMLEMRRWQARIKDTLDSSKEERVFRAFTSIAQGFRSYILTRTVTSAITGVLTSLFLWACDVDFPLLWGCLAYLLNYIPTVGSLVAVVPPSLLAALQHNNLALGLGVLAGQTVLQLSIGQYLDPRLQGKNLQLSPLLVLFAIMFWAFMWGAAGALIAIPITVVIIVACRQFEGSRWIADLASDDG